MTGSIRNFEKLNFTPKSSVFCFSQGQTSKYDRLAPNSLRPLEIEEHKNSFALPKLLYFLRTAPGFLYEQLLQNYDNTLQKSVEEICNITLDHISASQLHWPSTLGGLGISSAFITAPSAYLASAESCRTIIASILPDGLVNVPVTIGQAFEKWQQQSNCVERPVHPHVQSNWTGPAFKHMLATTLTLVDNNNRKSLMAFQGKEAAAWINALPSQALVTFDQNGQNAIYAGFEF